jgi:Rrf2 family protein
MMGLSTKGRYATRILVHLADCDPETPAPKQVIAKAEGLTPDYVEQILIRLKSAGFVESHRGKTGGFSLSADPASITVRAVLESVEGDLSLAPCGAGKPCVRANNCPTRPLWEKATSAMLRVFEGATIADLLEEQHRQNENGSLHFDI